MMKPIKELLIVLLAIAVVFVFGAPALAALIGVTTRRLRN